MVARFIAPYASRAFVLDAELRKLFEQLVLK
jgi:hypothetical protein